MDRFHAERTVTFETIFFPPMELLKLGHEEKKIFIVCIYITSKKKLTNKHENLRHILGRCLLTYKQWWWNV